MTFIEKKYPEWVKKYGVEMADRLRQKSADVLGEDAVLDKAEDVLMAISVVADHAHKSTGDRKYKDIEDISLSMVDDMGKGMSDEVVVDRAVSMMEKRGWNHE